MELGFQLKPAAPDTTSAVADIYLEEMDAHHIFVTDDYLPQPTRPTNDRSAANRGVVAKYTRYVHKYIIAQEDVIPLVFETYIRGLRSCHFRIPSADNVDDCKQ